MNIESRGPAPPDVAPSESPAATPDWTSPPTVAPVQRKDESKDLFLKYFVHGAAYSIIMVGVVLIWVFVAVMATVCGGILGIILAFGLLLIFVGAVNSFLADSIWNIKDESGVITFLAHGLFLFLLLLVASIPQYLVNNLANNILVTIVLFLIYCPIDGYIAKYVAEEFKGRSYSLGQL